MTKADSKRIKESVWLKINDGSLRSALERYNIPSAAVESIIRQCLNNQAPRNKQVDNGNLRSALENTYWSEDEIDFLIYRSQSTVNDIDEEN